MILECRLVAVPEPDITWYCDGKEINTKENVTVMNESDMHMYTSIVKICNVKKSQEGNYSVFARNREGEAYNELTLKVLIYENPTKEIKNLRISLMLR